MKARWLVFAAAIAAFPGAAAAQVSDDVVKIGVLDDMSGPYADQTGPGGVLAVEMAVEDFGKQVLGKPIVVVSADHQNKADVGAAIARKWFEAEQTDMVVGLGNSAVALAVQQLAKEKNHIDIVSGAASTELTGKQCSPTGIHWTYDTHALAAGTTSAVMETGGDSWFFLTADYAFGYSLQESAADVVKSHGGKILGQVRHPLNAADFSSYLLQAQASKAKIIGLADAGGDTIVAVKQAAEFGIGRKGQDQRLVALLLQITDVHSLGLAAAQGLVWTEAFYWDMNDEARAWSKRFMARHKNAPTMVQAGMYGATMHYLKAIRDAGTDAAPAVMAKMRETPINDFMTRGGWLREDGRVMRDMLLLQAKKPSESVTDWDYARVLRTIPAADAFRSLAKSECPLVKK